VFAFPDVQSVVPHVGQRLVAGPWAVLLSLFDPALEELEHGLRVRTGDSTEQGDDLVTVDARARTELPEEAVGLGRREVSPGQHARHEGAGDLFGDVSRVVEADRRHQFQPQGVPVAAQRAGCRNCEPPGYRIVVANQSSEKVRFALDQPVPAAATPAERVRYGPLDRDVPGRQKLVGACDRHGWS
jgi:hypothetical protein